MTEKPKAARSKMTRSNGPGKYLLSFVSGVVSGIVATLLVHAATSVKESLETRSTEFKVSLADVNCSAGDIAALVRQRKRLGHFDTDDLAEHTRICANDDFLLGSTDYVIHQVKNKYAQCFSLTLEQSTWVLRLQVASPSVCRNPMLSKEGEPVYYCLLGAADAGWHYEKGLKAPRECPNAVITHFSKRNTTPEIVTP